MWARTQLRIGWRDLLAGAAACLIPGDRDALKRDLERYWDDGRTTLTAFSVRSGFEALLMALDLEEGDEVIFSALNVRGMVKIVRSMGLVPVPVDLDVAHMGPSMERLKAAMTPRSRVFVAAHLFGTHLDLDQMFDFVRDAGILAVEDCAQAFNGKAYAGNMHADVNMFSFGPLKTATSLGGGLIRVRDQAMAEKVRAIQSGFAVQSNRKQLKRVAQFAFLKIVTSRPVLGAIYRYYHARGVDYEDAVADKVRDVAPMKKAKNRQFQPSAGMLALMRGRITRFVEGSLEERRAQGERLRELIGDAVVLPAQANAYHDYWVFPLLIDNPKPFIAELRAQGFDASDLPRSQAVEAPEGREALTPHVAAAALGDLIVVPCYPGMPDRELVRLAEAVRQAAKGAGTERTRDYAVEGLPAQLAKAGAA